MQWPEEEQLRIEAGNLGEQIEHFLWTGYKSKRSRHSPSLKPRTLKDIQQLNLEKKRHHKRSHERKEVTLRLFDG